DGGATDGNCCSVRHCFNAATWFPTWMDQAAGSPLVGADRRFNAATWFPTWMDLTGVSKWIGGVLGFNAATWFPTWMARLSPLTRRRCSPLQRGHVVSHVDGRCRR